ncbi:MAG: MerR family transcriptional regulator [Oscillospiraceae bacterium]|nr:MerR family transcriptional regulator [Oscillospiraceae bacterium]
MQYSIGDVAKLFGISAFSIRFYEKKGLLKPIVDSKTSYRFYTLPHIIKIRAILYLKTAGFSIDEIKEITDGQSYANIDKRLYAKEIETQQKMEELQACQRVLKTLKSRTRYIIAMDGPFQLRYNSEDIVLAMFEGSAFTSLRHELCADYTQQYLCVKPQHFVDGALLGHSAFATAITPSNLFYLEQQQIAYQKVLFHGGKAQKYLYTLLEWDYVSEPLAMQAIVSHLQEKQYRIVSDIILRYIAISPASMQDLYEVWIPIA